MGYTLVTALTSIMTRPASAAISPIVKCLDFQDVLLKHPNVYTSPFSHHSSAGQRSPKSLPLYFTGSNNVHKKNGSLFDEQEGCDPLTDFTRSIQSRGVGASL